MIRLLQWILRDSHRRFAVSVLAGGCAFFLLRNHLSRATVAIVTWDAFTVSILILVWVTIIVTPQSQLRVYAKAQDLSRLLIFAFVIAAACAALFTVAFVIRNHHEEMRGNLTAHVLLALATVTLSWLVLHTVFSLHYAHIFYGDDRAGQGLAGGLDFPGDRLPDYTDFAYFSFVIGMTCQVSDVQVTSATMRRLTLLHGILSFGYNTVILALLINTVSSLL